MRFSLRTAAVATVAALTAAVLTVREPRTAAAQPADLPADLALVPADALGFVHVRYADLWKNEAMADFRKTWEKAGPAALAGLDKQFVPAPSTVSRATAFVVMGEHGPKPIGVLAFSAAFDPAAVVKAYLPEHTTAKVGDKTVYQSPAAAVDLYFPDDRHIVVGGRGAVVGYLAKAPAKTGPLAPALKLAAGGAKVMVAAADVSGLPIPPKAFGDAPPAVRPLLKATRITLAVDLGADARLDLRAGYADAAAAGDAEKSLQALAEMGRAELAKAKKELEAKLAAPTAKTPRPAEDLVEALGTVFALGSVNRMDEALADPKFVTRDGTELALAVPLPKGMLATTGVAGIGVGLLLPAVQKVRAAAARTQSSNNLKQIGIAIHSFHDANGRFPMDIVDKNGKPLLSWRVEILPYLEQNDLYEKFKLDEPWDSPNNKEWSQVMVKTFMAANATPPEKFEWGMTSYRGISGPGAAFEAGKKLKFTDFTDGTSNTVMVIETDEWVPWAKPVDFPFDPKEALPKIVPAGKLTGFNVLFVDGSVRWLGTSVAEKTLKALFTRAGGEVNELDKDN
jgi:prepilin-type processing-associated H-X9-DG protein